MNVTRRRTNQKRKQRETDPKKNLSHI
jgi:hypothetical protein